MKTIDSGYNYFECYLTYRCRLGCSYCINGDVQRNCSEMSGERWVADLNDIDFGSMPLTLGGGEPTQHRDFYFIINNLRRNIKVELLTNLTFDVDEFIRSVTSERFTIPDVDSGYKSIRVSYHAGRTDPNELIAKAAALQGVGFSVGIFAINYPDSIAANIKMAELARRKSIYFFIKDYLGTYRDTLLGCYRFPAGLDNQPKPCQCRTREMLVSPSGLIYRCHKDLYTASFPVGSISDEGELPKHIYRPCAQYGLCNPCDVKLKTNRFLAAGNSSVDILPA